MKDSIARIGKIKMKNGGAEIRLIPTMENSVAVVPFHWGELVFRMYDNSPITNETMLFLLEAAKLKIIRKDM